jgi:hypothetical protein
MVERCQSARTVRANERGRGRRLRAQRCFRRGHERIQSYTSVRAVAIRLIRRRTTATEHHARIVTRRPSRIECKIASNYVRTVGPHIESCRNHGHSRKPRSYFEVHLVEGSEWKTYDVSVQRSIACSGWPFRPTSIDQRLLWSAMRYDHCWPRLCKTRFRYVFRSTKTPPDHK